MHNTALSLKTVNYFWRFMKHAEIGMFHIPVNSLMRT
jgi:hypothetical protein